MGNYIRCGKDESTDQLRCYCGTDEANIYGQNDEGDGIISNRVCFGAGCYWGTEKYIRHDFGEKRHPESNIKGMVGFMGPPNAPENPTYKDVCTGVTGHVEVYSCEFDGGEEIFEKLVRFFFQFHDPTTVNRQGNDKAKVKTELQVILDKNLLGSSIYVGKTVTTAIEKATKFYPAHAAHQDYLMKNPKGYCNHKIRFQEWPNYESVEHTNGGDSTRSLDAPVASPLQPVSHSHSEKDSH